jgi:hypothetical protein
MTSNTPSMSISTDASAKILPNFTGLTFSTVIETVLKGQFSMSSGGAAGTSNAHAAKHVGEIDHLEEAHAPAQ